MALKEQISDEMKAALLGGNRFVGETLRNLKAAILNEEVAQGKRDEGLSDADIEKVIAREAKKRVESAKVYRDNNRPELAEPEEQELAILQQYLPKQMTEDELRAIVKEKIAKIGEKISIRRFVRYQLGEGIEKKQEDFAAEVMAQVK